MCGAAGGLGLLGLLDRYQLIRVPADIYQISHVPFTLETLDVVVVIVSAVVICFAATIYPSRLAARLDPHRHSGGNLIAWPERSGCRRPS